jgi:hypothetical protein
MSIFANQTFKKKIQYLKNNEYEKSVTFSISISTNHELDRDVLASIEKSIDSLFISDYVDIEELKDEQKLIDEEEKEELKLEKEQLKLEKEKLRLEKEKVKADKDHQKALTREKAEYKAQKNKNSKKH